MTPHNPIYFIRGSIVASISACHAEDPGSIPGLGVFMPPHVIRHSYTCITTIIHNRHQTLHLHLRPYLRLSRTYNTSHIHSSRSTHSSHISTTTPTTLPFLTHLTILTINVNPPLTSKPNHTPQPLDTRHTSSHVTLS